MAGFVSTTALTAVRPRGPVPGIASRAAPTCCEASPPVSRFSVGDRVRVVGSPLIMYHIAGAKNEPTDVCGYTGSVLNVIHKVKGHPITATKPVLVAFEDPKFRGHFDDSELEPAS